MNIFRLENNWVLFFLFLIPIFIVIFIWMRFTGKNLLLKFGESRLINSLMPANSQYKPFVKFVLLLAGLALLIIGTANPQIGSKMEEVKREGVDIMIAVDVSNSMKAEDIKPNRLERAKQSIQNLIDNLVNDRIGIIAFAGDAFLLLPLTSDYSAAKLFLSTMDCDIIETQGTAMGKAINLAVESFPEEKTKKRALIIITDGENHEDDALGAATEAAKENVVIHTIGMGSPDGAPIPVYKNGAIAAYMKDNSGNIIITKLNQEMLSQIAAAGNGNFTRSGSGGIDLKAIIDDIAGMEKTQYQSKMFTDYEDRFQYFIAIALLMLIIEFFISGQKNKIIESLNLFGIKKK